MKKKILLVSLGLLLVISLVATGCPAPTPAPAPAPAKVFNWKMWDGEPPGSPFRSLKIKFTDTIREMSGGRLNIELADGAPMGYKGTETLRVMKDGGVEMSLIAAGWSSGDLPIMALADFAMLNMGPESTYVTIETAREVWEEATRDFDTIIIGYGMRDEQVTYTVDKPIQSIADFKGMKIRVWNEPMADLIGALGGLPVFIAFPEQYSAAARGVIDGMITGGSAGLGLKFPEVADYFLTDFGIAHAVYLTYVSGQYFRQLPPDLQQILLVAGELSTRWYVNETTRLQEEAFALLQEGGMTRTRLDPAEVKKAQEIAKGLWYQGAKEIGPEAEELLEKIIAAQKKAGYLR